MINKRKGSNWIVKVEENIFIPTVSAGLPNKVAKNIFKLFFLKEFRRKIIIIMIIIIM